MELTIVCISLLTLLFCSCFAQTDVRNSTFQVGIILDMYLLVGRVGMTCLSLADSDFYLENRNTQIVFHVRDSKNYVIDAASAALNLLRDVEFDAIIGPQKSAQASFGIGLGARANVPIFVSHCFLLLVMPQNYDGAVGDISITYKRSKYVDFTFPFTAGGVTMIVPKNAQNQLNNKWFFFKPLPLTTELWLTSLVLFIYTGAVFWILEHRFSSDYKGGTSNQLGMIFYVPFMSMVYAQSELFKSTFSRPPPRYNFRRFYPLQPRRKTLSYCRPRRKVIRQKYSMW